ncbi:MAG: hypothetical protein GW778_03265 [Alphaproteobacteria bacterium]|nr:hypothetical protein [Alphaproteobacteria bacterium]
MLKLIAFVVFMIVLMPLHGFAQDKICEASNRECIFSALIRTTGSIENPIWRDQSYREIAKSLAADGRFDDAFDVWEKIENPDTKALTIRGIGMAVADFELPKDQYDALFKALRARSETITHPPSYAIALTYIAMAQAFAKDDEGAWATAASMENEALRYKAYGESAEIQAERGDLGAAMKSIGYIESAAFRNKAYALVSKLLADQAMFDEALQAAVPLDNAYKKAKALQYILDQQAALQSEN